MLELWQNLPLSIEPIIFHIGSFAIRWYSLSYIAAFATVYLLIRFRIYKKENPNRGPLTKDSLEELFAFCVIGLMIGARFGYLLFYDFSGLISHPLSSISPFQDGSFTGFFGLSYHGGLIGAVLAGLLFCKKNKLKALQVADFVIPAIPLGYAWGRFGNFMNGELFGRETESLLGMHFQENVSQLRHPSQLYEALGEGILLFALLWTQRNNPKLENKFLGLYVLLYGVVRFFIEFVREPDAHIGTILWGLTTGQLLCLGMIITGLLLITTPRKSSRNI